MKFVSAIVAAAVALATGVSAANTTTTFTATTGNSVPAGGSSVTDNGVETIVFNIASKHSSFIFASWSTAASTPYSYSYSGNLTTAITNQSVASASSATAVKIPSALTTTVCNANVTVGTAYNFNAHPAFYQPSTGSASASIPVNLTGYADTQIQLTNATGVSLAAVDSADNKFQPGKFYYFNVPANATAGAGNIVNATISLAGASNPFTFISVVGAGLCPILNSSDSIVRQGQNLSALTALTGSTALTVSNIITGNDFWVYLAPSSALAAGTASNNLGATDYITLTYGATNGTTCKTTGTNGFCSGAATLKSAAGVAFAGLMAAAAMLL